MKKTDDADGRGRENQRLAAGLRPVVADLDNPPFAVCRCQQNANQRLRQEKIKQVQRRRVKHGSEVAFIDNGAVFNPEHERSDNCGGNQPAGQKHPQRGSHFLRIVRVGNRLAVTEPGFDKMAQVCGGKGCGDNVKQRVDNVVVSGCHVGGRQLAVPVERRLYQFEGKFGKADQ